MKSIRILLVAFIICLFSSVKNVFGQTDDPLIQFGLIADSQYADCEPKGNRFYRNSLKKIEECVDSLNNRKVQFTINLGDIVDQNIRELDSVLTYLGHLDNKIYNITGNHDYNGVTNNEILYKKLRMPSEYYFFKKKNWVFIFLNTNEVAAYSNVVGTEKEEELSAMLDHIKSTGGIQGAGWNGGISAKQLEWLDKLLAESEKSRENVLIFSHHPLYPETEFTALNNMDIIDVIDTYSCVKAVFSGHHHAGKFAYFKNIPVITVEGMVETKDENSFGIVKIYNDKIVLDGNGRMISRVLVL